MMARRHPRGPTADETAALVGEFDDHSDDEDAVTDAVTLRELRAAVAARREAGARIEAAALAAHRAGLSRAIGARLGMTRQGVRQRFERLVNHGQPIAQARPTRRSSNRRARSPSFGDGLCHHSPPSARRLCATRS
jgi:hypothetical protein